MIKTPQPPDTGTAGTPEGCTCSRLRRLTRRLTAVYDRELASCGLRVTQFSLLAALQRQAGSGGMAVSVLADALDMDRTTLTRNLKPLIDRGHVELAGARGDARVRLVSITAAGTAAWRSAQPHWKRAQLDVHRTLGETTVAGLHQWLDAVTPAFRPLSEGTP